MEYRDGRVVRLSDGDMVWDPAYGMGLVTHEIRDIGDEAVLLVRMSRPVRYQPSQAMKGSYEYPDRQVVRRGLGISPLGDNVAPLRGALPPKVIDIALRMIANREVVPSRSPPVIRYKWEYPAWEAAHPFWGRIRVMHDLLERRRRAKRRKKDEAKFDPNRGTTRDADEYRARRDDLFYEIIATEMQRQGKSKPQEVEREARSMLARAIKGYREGFPLWTV